MKHISRYILTLVALFSLTTGAWAQEPATVPEVTVLENDPEGFGWQFLMSDYAVLVDMRYEPDIVWMIGDTPVGEEGLTCSPGFDLAEPTLYLPYEDQQTDEFRSLITYESSNQTVATVDAATGAVTCLSIGETNITAVFAGNDAYGDITVSYKLTVVEPLTLTLTPSDFGTLTAEGAGSGSAESELLVTITAGSPISYSSETVETPTDVAEITMTGATNMGSWMDINAGVHFSWINPSNATEDKGSLVVTAKPGYTITKVVFSGLDSSVASGSHEVTESPFAVYPWFGGVYQSDSYEDGIEGGENSNIRGITEIKVYGYVGSAATNVLPTETEGVYSVIPGSEITLKATANEGYYATGWKKGTADVTEGVAYDDYYEAATERMPATSTLTLTLDGDATYSAMFAEGEYNLTFKAANANTIKDGKATVSVDEAPATLTHSEDGSKSTLEGMKKSQVITISAATGYKFRKVEVKKKEPLLSFEIEQETTIYYLAGETWTQAITKHPDENAKWAVKGTDNQVYFDPDGGTNYGILYENSSAVSKDDPIDTSKTYAVDYDS